MAENDVGSQLRQASAWLKGYIQVSRKVPNKAYIPDKTSDDRSARLALAQLLVDGNATQEILDLLATCISPDCEPSDDISCPAIGEPLVSTTKPMRMLPEPQSRRLDFSFRTGKRKRGAPQISDPVRDGAILSKIMKLISEGTTKTVAFEKVGKEVGLSCDAVRAVWRRHRSFTAFWEADR